MGQGFDLKDQMIQIYLTERKRMHKWYHKLFKRLLNATLLNALTVYRKNCDKHVEHLSFRVLLVEGLFLKNGTIGKRKVGQAGRHASGNMIPRLTGHHFLRKVKPTRQIQDPREDVLCVPSTVERRLCTAAGSTGTVLKYTI
jgi:hypothetical protein